MVAPSATVSTVIESPEASALDLRMGEGVIHTTYASAERQTLQVFDAMGRLRAEWPTWPGMSMTWVVSDWDSGVYVVRGRDGAQARFVLD